MGLVAGASSLMRKAVTGLCDPGRRIHSKMEKCHSSLETNDFCKYRFRVSRETLLFFNKVLYFFKSHLLLFNKIKEGQLSVQRAMVARVRMEAVRIMRVFSSS